MFQLLNLLLHLLLYLHHLKLYKDLANPLATILSAAMMLRYTFNQEAAAQRIERAVKKVLAQGYRTGDIFEPGTKRVGTREMGDAVLAAL